MNKPASATKRILLAEDDEDDFILFQVALKEYKEIIHLDWVMDGEELMNVLKMNNTELPDMIFLDINMPRKNGFECLTEIRQNENLKHLPVIIFSTSNAPAVIGWMYNAGANLYLSKSIDFSVLKENIQKTIAMDWVIHPPYSSVKDFVIS